MDLLKRTPRRCDDTGSSRFITAYNWEFWTLRSVPSTTKASEKIVAEENPHKSAQPASGRLASQVAQYQSSIIKFHMSIAKITPATESAKACLASRLPSNLTIFIVTFHDRDIGFGGGG
jgi:hypothetical protein